MPNVPSDQIPAEIRQRVRGHVQAALNAGRGVAVVPMRDLLPHPTDEDHLNGDPYEAHHVLQQVSFLLGYSEAVYVDLPLYANQMVVLVRDPMGMPRTAARVPNLIDAFRTLRTIPAGGQADAAEKLATALRDITPRSVAAMRT